MHDKKICDVEQIQFLKPLQVIADLGFLVLSSQIAKVLLPIKEKRKTILNQEEKKYNQLLAKVRIEHIIASVKVFRKVKEKFRGRMFNREDKVMLIACALYNLKMKVRFA